MIQYSVVKPTPPRVSKEAECNSAGNLNGQSETSFTLIIIFTTESTLGAISKAICKNEINQRYGEDADLVGGGDGRPEQMMATGVGVRGDDGTTTRRAATGCEAARSVVDQVFLWASFLVLSSPNDKFLEIVFFLIWHIFQQVVKSQDLPS